MKHLYEQFRHYTFKNIYKKLNSTVPVLMACMLKLKELNIVLKMEFTHFLFLLFFS